MILKTLLWLLINVCAVPLAEAQQTTKIPRIGYLGGSAATNPTRIAALRKGLGELGYVEGKNIVAEIRLAEGRQDRERALAAEFVRAKVDVIVTVGSTATRAAQEVTATIPIVMTQDPDPVGNGFVASLARQGGNITGLSNYNRELSGKRLELLREVIARLSRVAVFGTSTQPGHAQALKETELAAGALRVKVQYLGILVSKDIETAFRKASNAHAEAVLGLGVLCSILSEHELLQLRQRAGSPRSTAFGNMWKAADL